MWIVSASNASLSDYTMMLEFMGRDFVSESFLVFNHLQNVMQMVLMIKPGEDIDVKGWLPMFLCLQFDDVMEGLDQGLTIDGCLIVAMATCDLVHTKNLENTRQRLTKRLGLTIADTAVIVDKEEVK